MSLRFRLSSKWMSRLPIVTSIEPVAGLRPAILVEAQPQSLTAPPAGGAQVFAAMLDGANAALERADVASSLLAAGKGSIAEAAILRAKADVALEIAAVAASRAGAAITTLLQTQV